MPTVAAANSLSSLKSTSLWWPWPMLHTKMLGHHINHYYLTEKINHFIKCTFVWKTGKGAEFFPLWDILSYNSPHCYPFYFSCCQMVSTLPIFPSSLAIFPLNKYLFPFLYIHFASYITHIECLEQWEWPFHHNMLPKVPAQQCDISTVWQRLLWTDINEWYQIRSHTGSAHLSWCHCRPLLVSGSQSQSPGLPPWCSYLLYREDLSVMSEWSVILPTFQGHSVHMVMTGADKILNKWKIN